MRFGFLLLLLLKFSTCRNYVLKDIDVDLLQNLSSHLSKAKVSYFPINSPPALSNEPQGTQNVTGQYSDVNFFFQFWFSSYLASF